MQYHQISLPFYKMTKSCVYKIHLCTIVDDSAGDRELQDRVTGINGTGALNTLFVRSYFILELDSLY